MSKQNYEVVVIGRGIIGYSIAYYLVIEKSDVVLFERGRIGESTAVGMLGAHSESNDYISVFLSFARCRYRIRGGFI